MKRSLCAIAMLLAAGIGGCHKSSSNPASTSVNQYEVKGTVEGLDTANGYVVLNADAIPGYMDAMTMTFQLRAPATIAELHVGDKLVAHLTVDENVQGPAGLLLDDVDVIAEARPDTLPKVQYHVPAPGDAVPDVTLLNQDGHKISLAKFRGKVLVLTFVYTRCPLSNFCPQMSRNFAEIDKALSADPRLYAETHLLSISFDPAYDTPKVLRSYGGAYTGRYTRENFAHWDFAAPGEAELPKVEQWFDLGVTPGPGKTLQHSLATVIVGRDGKVVAFYPTNDWAVQDVLARVKAAAAG